MKTQILLAWILGMFFLGGCLEDGTNLNYIELQTVDTIMITNLKGGDKQRVSAIAMASFRADPGQELCLVAKAVYEGGEKVTFRWVAANKKEVSVGDTLKHIFTSEDAGTLMLFAYRGDHPGANVYQVGITLNNVFAGGLVVLAKDNGKTVLDYIQNYRETKNVEYLDGLKYNVTFYRYTPHENVYSQCNDGEELKSSDPLGLSYSKGFLDWTSNPTPLAALQILDRNWKNSIAINVTGMKKITYMEDEFLDVPSADFYPKTFRNIGALSLLQGETGEIYTRVNYDRGHSCTGRFSTLPVMYNEPYDVPDKGSEKVIATEIHSKSNWAVIYEQTKKRFLLITGAGSMDQWGAPIDYCKVFDFSRPSAELPEGALRMDNFEKEIYAIIPSQAYQNDLFIIYKDGGEYYVQTCSMSLDTWSKEHTFSYSVKKTPLKLPAETAALFNQKGSFIEADSDPGGGDLILVGAGKSIYKLDILRGSVTKVIEFKEANMGNITLIQKLVWFEAPGYNERSRFYVGRLLATAFDNGDLKLLRVYDDPRSPDEIHYEYLFEKNYSGEIVDLLNYSY